MKTQVFLVLLFFTSDIICQDCSPISAGYRMKNGSLTYNILADSSGYNKIYYRIANKSGSLPSEQIIPIIKNRSFWMSGTTRAGSLRMNASTSQKFNWRSGFRENPGLLDTALCRKWDKIFVVTSEEISEARKILKEGRPCEEMPSSILSWPAKTKDFQPDIPSYRGAAYYSDYFEEEYDPCLGHLPSIPISLFWFPGSIKELSYHIMQPSINPIFQSVYNVSLYMEVYNFTIDAPEADNTIFTLRKISHIGLDDIIDRYVSFYHEPPTLCNSPIKMGSSSEHYLTYFYPAQPACLFDGQTDFSLIMGHQVLKGGLSPKLKVKANGKDTLVDPPAGSGAVDTLVEDNVTSIYIDTTCQSNISNCISLSSASQIYNIQKGLSINGDTLLDQGGNRLKYWFDIDNKSGRSTMCGIEKKVSFSLSNLGPKLTQRGVSNTILTATFTIDSVKNMCNNDLFLKDKASQIKQLFDQSFYTPLSPPNPNIKGTFTKNEIELTFIDIPFDYKAGLHYDLSEGCYHFEGIKIYQVRDTNVSRNELDDPNLAKLIYQGDLANEVGDISNWTVGYYGDSAIYKEI